MSEGDINTDPYTVNDMDEVAELKRKIASMSKEIDALVASVKLVTTLSKRNTSDTVVNSGMLDGLLIYLRDDATFDYEKLMNIFHIEGKRRAERAKKQVEDMTSMLDDLGLEISEEGLVVPKRSKVEPFLFGDRVLDA